MPQRNSRTPDVARNVGRFFWFWLIAFGVKAAALVFLHDHPLLQPRGGLDTAYYVAFGERVASGDLALDREPFFLSPLYIYFLGAVLSVSTLTGVKLVQIALGASAVVLIGKTAHEWFGATAGRIAASLALLTGIFSFYELTLLPAALDPFLTALALWLLTIALKPTGARIHFGLAGAAFGLSALNRPNMLLCVVAVTALLIIFKRFSPALLLAAGAAFVIAPVTIRNLAVSGERVLISSHGGLNFYIGNHDEADGTYKSVPGVRPDIRGQQIDTKRITERAIGRSASAVDVSRHFYDRAFAWILSEPSAALALFARKVLYVLNAADLPLNYSYSYFARDVASPLRLLIVGPWLLIPLGVTGLIHRLLAERDRSFVVWASVIPFYALSVALFFVSGRYRLPLLVPLIVTSSFALVTAASLIAARNYRALGRRALLLIALSVISWYDFGLDDGRANERTSMVVYLIEKGDLPAATRLLEETAREHPRPSLLYYRAGHAFHARRDFASAGAAYQRALELDPGRAEIRSSLGGTLLAAGNVSAAAPHLAAAFEADVDPQSSGTQLVEAIERVGDAEAREILERLRPTPRAPAPILVELGRVAVSKRLTGIAQGFLRQAVTKEPENAAAHHWLGMSYAVEGRDAEAIESLQTAVELEPGNAATHQNLAVLYARGKRYDDARIHATRALALKPDYANAAELLAMLDRMR